MFLAACPVAMNCSILAGPNQLRAKLKDANTEKASLFAGEVFGCFAVVSLILGSAECDVVAASGVLDGLAFAVDAPGVSRGTGIIATSARLYPNSTEGGSPFVVSPGLASSPTVVPVIVMTVDLQEHAARSDAAKITVVALQCWFKLFMSIALSIFR